MLCGGQKTRGKKLSGDANSRYAAFLRPKSPFFFTGLLVAWCASYTRAPMLAAQEYASVEEYVELPGVGHCPMDEAPDLVNPLVLSFVQRHGKDTA